MPPVRAEIEIAFANLGRKYSKGPEGEDKFTRNLRTFLRAFPKASKGLAEIDEADPANEHDITLEQAHRMLARYYDKAGVRLRADLEPFEYDKGALAPGLEEGGDEKAFADFQNARRRGEVVQFAGFWQATPIICAPKFDLLGSKIVKTTDGKAGVSPHRVCVTSMYDAGTALQKEMGEAPFVHHNGHFPFKWPAGWNTCFDTWCDIVRKYKKQGISQFITLDTNTHKKFVLHPQQQIMAGQHGIDKILFIPGDSVRIKPYGHVRNIALNIDGHNGLGRRAYLL